jgi:hypothetical protein
MYKCTLLKHIWQDEQKTIQGKVIAKEMCFDFLPFKGLVIHDKENSTYADVGVVELISYYEGKSLYTSSEKCFVLDVSDSYPWHSELMGYLDYNKIIDLYLGQGWVDAAGKISFQSLKDPYIQNKE